MTEIYIVSVTIEPIGIILMEAFTNRDEALSFSKHTNIVKHFTKDSDWHEETIKKIDSFEYEIYFHTRILK